MVLLPAIKIPSSQRLHRLRHLFRPLRIPGENPRGSRLGIRRQRQFLPSVHLLEPRLVLNASAELNALGQLVVTGTDVAETVHMQVNSDGELLLWEAGNQLIPIAGHPLDPSAPLSLAALTSNQIFFDLRGGDDLLRLQLPQGIDLFVIDGEGQDQTEIVFIERGGVDPANVIHIESESIVLLPDTSVSPLNRLIRLEAEQVVFAGEVMVDDGLTAEINATITGDGLTKSGGGTLVLSQSNAYTGITDVRQGTLVVNGSIESGADVFIASGAQLSGTGTIAGRVHVAANATTAPGVPTPALPGDSLIASLRTGGLVAAPASVLEFQINGIQGDQIDVTGAASGAIMIDGAVLDLTVSGSIAPATEFILIKNDGTDPIQGNLVARFASDGSTLNFDRVLHEGATVLDSFGATGQAGHLTYFGGDGNDVAIVTAGGFDVLSGGTTVIVRNGSNLEIRTGPDLATATLAAPVIRPIEGRDDTTVRIVGTSANDQLWIDVDQFKDVPSGSVPFTGRIVFQAGDAVGDADQLVLFDSNPLNNGADPDIAYQWLGSGSGGLVMTSSQGASLLRLDWQGTEAIVQNFVTAHIALQYADTDDQIRLSTDPMDPSRTQVTVASNGVPATSLSFVNPAASLAIRGGDGNDRVTFDGLGNGFAAALFVDGQLGQDVVSIDTTLNLGTGNVAGTLDIAAETIRIHGDVNTIGTSIAGDVTLRGETEVQITGQLQVGAGALTIDGGGGAIDTGLGRFVATATEDPIRIVNASSVILGDVIARDGTLVLGVDGNVSGPISQAALARVDVGYLRASTLGSIDLGNAANELAVIEELIAGGDVRIHDAANDLRVMDLFTSVGLVSITNSAGNIELVSVANQLGNIDVQADGPTSEIVIRNLTTTNGEIRVRATQSIEIIAFTTSDEGDDPGRQREIMAGGDHGRVTLIAGDTLRLGDAVHIHASQSSVAAVTLQANHVEFGHAIEINTGQGVGIARVFAPRPLNPPSETSSPDEAPPLAFAFYDPESISTERLRQANVNDATGILTIDVGQAGERGLTVNIDWGAETGRFQQIDHVSADDALFVDVGSDAPRLASGDPVLRIEHFYSEDDIIFSRLNGREAETKPLNVRFSVRHHESIVVLANSVSQGGGPVEAVSAGVVSATDNDDPRQGLPLEALTLLNGTAFFIIPSLTIPVAFFPIRDVIPEFEEPEVFVRSDSSVFVPQSSLQTVEAAASETTIRDEYLQIRMLSPDPSGKDLAPPERLPDDILDGDRLQQLFADLPDGRYEIQYVLGDGNERLILRVDLRGGRPSMADDGQPEGTLRLTPIDEDVSIPEHKEQDEKEQDDEEQKTQKPPAMEADENVRQGTQEEGRFAVWGNAAILVTMPLARSSNRGRREGFTTLGSRFSKAMRMRTRINRDRAIEPWIFGATDLKSTNDGER